MAAAVERPFLTIGARLKTVGEKLAVFFGHPYCPTQLAEGLTELLAAVEDLRQEVAEQGVPCPCKPAPTPTTAAASDAVPGAASAQVDLTTKWPTFEDALTAFHLGAMTADEAAAFQALQAKVDAFTASLHGSGA